MHLIIRVEPKSWMENIHAPTPIEANINKENQQGKPKLK
jgi:hypothetical protein